MYSLTDLTMPCALTASPEPREAVTGLDPQDSRFLPVGAALPAAMSAAHCALLGLGPSLQGESERSGIHVNLRKVLSFIR